MVWVHLWAIPETRSPLPSFKLLWGRTLALTLPMPRNGSVPQEANRKANDAHAAYLHKKYLVPQKMLSMPE